MTARGGLAFRATVLLSSVLAATAASAQGRFVDARLSSQAAGDLSSTVHSLAAAARGPEWVGYAVPAVSGQRNCCVDCGNGRSASLCRLEDGDGSSSRNDAAPNHEPVPLEASADAAVLLRVDHGVVNRVRVFGGDCPLDAGGLAVHWLTGVEPAASLKLLAAYVEPRNGHDDLSNGALAAIALHADAGADTLLEGYAASGEPMELRKQAAFWMGVTRGRRGFEDLRRLAAGDAAPELREHVAFALSQSREPEAVGEIIRMARRDASPRVRGQALFWLAHKAGQKAVSAISEAIREDPETEVKTKAVFALSQLPRDEGVPLLIRQARTNRNPEVRKQALFWLGQSGDPRALALFEEILGR